MMIPFRGYAPLLIIAIAGCADAGDDPGVPVARDSAGVRIVEYAELPVFEILSLPEVPTLQLGVVEGDPAQEFSWVSSATRLSDGTIVVADRGASQLRAFGPDGSHLWTSGRSGDGPGEYRNIAWVREHGDSIAVFDRSLARLSVLTQGGELVRAVSLGLTPEGTRPLVIHLSPDGSMIVGAQISLTPNLPPGIHRPTIHFSAYSPEGEPTNSITSISGMEWVVTAVDDQPLLAPRPYGSDGLLEASEVGLVVAQTERFEIKTFDPSGALRQILRIIREPRSVTAEDARRYIELRKSQTPDESHHPRIERMMGALPFAEVLPALRFLYLDRASRLWVEEYRLPGENQASFLVFQAEGRVLARVRFPPDHLFLEAGPGYLIARVRDELEVQYVRLYELGIS